MSSPNVYEPQDQDIKNIEKGLKTGDKARIRLALLKKHLSPSALSKMKRAIYFLLSYMHDNGVEYTNEFKMKDGKSGTYLQLLLDFIGKSNVKPLSEPEKIKECINEAFKNVVGDNNTIIQEWRNPDFKKLESFLSKENGNNKKASSKAGGVAGKSAKEHVSSSIEALDLAKPKNLSKKTVRERAASLSGTLSLEKLKNPIGGAMTRKRSNSTVGIVEKSGTDSEVGEAFGTIAKRQRRLSVSLGSLGRGKAKNTEDKTETRKRRNSFGGFGKKDGVGATADNAKFSSLVTLIKNNKKMLSKFYKEHKDDQYPDFIENFMDLKTFLNGGVRGASTLVFDDFLVKYLPKLNDAEIDKGIGLMNKAVDYVKRIGSWQKEIEKNDVLLGKKVKKIKEFYKIQSECKAFNEVGEICTKYKNDCLRYLSETANSEFNKKYDYLTLKADFPDDALKVYGIKSDRYHENLLNDYDRDKLYAKLTLDQEYGQVNDKMFNDHIELFEKCRKKAKEFLNSMYESALKGCDEKWLDEYTPANHVIPNPPIDKVDKKFEDVQNGLTKIKDGWKNL